MVQVDRVTTGPASWVAVHHPENGGDSVAAHRPRVARGEWPLSMQSNGASRRQRCRDNSGLGDLLDWKVSLPPGGEAPRDLRRPAAQGRLRPDRVFAEVDGARSLRTYDVLGERDRSCPRWGPVAATLELGPQIENLREAELHRVPCRLGLESPPDFVRILRHRLRIISPRATASMQSTASRPKRLLRQPDGFAGGCVLLRSNVSGHVCCMRNGCNGRCQRSKVLAPGAASELADGAPDEGGYGGHIRGGGPRVNGCAKGIHAARRSPSRAPSTARPASVAAQVLLRHRPSSISGFRRMKVGPGTSVGANLMPLLRTRRVMRVASPPACLARDPRRAAVPDVLSGRLHMEIDWTLSGVHVVQSREGAD